MYDRIIIASAGPITLLGNIKQAIDKGDIQTWAYDLQGDFTYVLAPWQDKAWLQPSAEGPGLVFRLFLAEKKVPHPAELKSFLLKDFSSVLSLQFEYLAKGHHIRIG